MKKLYTMVGVLTVLVLAAGCFTSASAHSKRTTAPDGTITLESDVKIVGTGDKASEVAAEGMFADGADDTLGAGVKNAKASQQSTGIKEAFEGVGSLLGGMGQFMAASRAPSVGMLTQDQITAMVKAALEANAAGATNAAAGACADGSCEVTK